MSKIFLLSFVVSLTTAALAIDAVPEADGALHQPTLDAQVDFKTTHPRAALRLRDGRISRVHGAAFSSGENAVQSAESFRLRNAVMFGVQPEELLPIGPFPSGEHVVPLLYEKKTGTNRFTGVFYTQSFRGVPVWDASMRCLVRNEPGHPLVLVSSNLRDVRALEGRKDIKPRTPAQLDLDRLAGPHLKTFGPGTRMSQGEQVIFAGFGDEHVPATLATTFVLSTSSPDVPISERAYRFFLDATTGALLHQENLTLHVVDGSVQANISEGTGADICEVEVPRGLPYARLNANGAEIFADADGYFTLPHDDGPLEITSALDGRYFDVINNIADDSSLAVTAQPDDTVTLLHNSDNANEFARAEVNAYYHANKTRDFVLEYSPSFPVISEQTDFPISVNHDDTSCNAIYSSATPEGMILMATSGVYGPYTCPNTAFRSVIAHEYGHHLIQSGGSGQGEYGEGMADAIAVLLDDQPIIGFGFLSDCASGIRSADNSCYYVPEGVLDGCSSCGNSVHACGQILSGCVWDLRTNLSLEGHPDYREIVTPLTINSILFHTGTSINSDIALDFLTLDDDDADIGNGTPHKEAIDSAFINHDVFDLGLSLVDGEPTSIDLSGHTFTLRVADTTTEHEQGWAHAMLRMLENGTSFWKSFPMEQVSPNEYTLTVPADLFSEYQCGDYFQYFFTVRTASSPFREQHLPETAWYPAHTPFSTQLAYGTIDNILIDDFEQDLGWTISGSAPASEDGRWIRTEPRAAYPAWMPQSDGDGSGQCYLTGLFTKPEYGYYHDLDGTTILTSPVLDASMGGTLEFSYFLNDGPDDPRSEEDHLAIELSIDGGATWTQVRYYQTFTSEWRSDEILIGEDGELPASDQMLIRVTAADLGPDNTIEAAFDGVVFQNIPCEAPGIPGDFDGNGCIDGADLATLLGNWAGSGLADLNEDGVVDGIDLAIILGSWGCP